MKFASLLVLCVSISSSGSAFAQEAEDEPKADAKLAAQLFERGRLLLFKSEFQAAAATLQEAVKADPSKTSYRLLLAKAHRYGGEHEKAIAVLESTLKNEPNHVEAGIELAELLSPSKQPDRVIAVLAPLRKFKRDYPLYHLLAKAYYHQGQLDRARDNFEQAIEVNPHNADDHFQLGNVYLAQKRFASAAAAYESAGKLGYSSAAFHFKLASVYFNLHNHLGKLETVEDPAGEIGQISSGRLIIDSIPGRPGHFLAAGPQSAAYQVAKAKQLNVDGFHVHYLEANIWLKAKRFARAAAIYESLEKDLVAAEAGSFWFHWAEAALAVEDYDQYIARLKKAIEAEPAVYGPALSNALQRVAIRHQQAGNLDLYIDFLEQAVALTPLSSRVHLALADAFWLNDERDSAARHYKMVLELQPEFPHRVALLNRVRGQDNSAQAIAQLAGPRGDQARPVSIKLAGVTCPVTGRPADAGFTVEHAGGRVHFASQAALADFASNKAKFTAAANHQLFRTGQAQLVDCPLTGRKLNPTIKVQVAGVDVPLCCKGCQSRVMRAAPGERLNLLFNPDSFAKHFKAVAPAK